MSYLPLGSKKATAAADATTLNAGNLTAVFNDANMGINTTTFELYHLALLNIPSNTTVSVYLGMQLYTVAQLDTIGDWDPIQPMILQPGQDIYICFNIAAASATIPVVTAWFRYDPLIAHQPAGA